MDEELKIEAEYLLECWERDGIEEVAKVYLGFEVRQRDDFDRMVAKVALEKYPLRKPTEEERKEALRIMNTEASLARRKHSTLEFYSNQVSEEIRQTPLKLVKLRGEHGYEKGTNRYSVERMASLYENSDSVREYKKRLPALNQRFGNLAKKLITE